MHLTWGYDLVSQVQPGDRVLHWQTRAPRGPVGWSEVELISLIGGLSTQSEEFRCRWAAHDVLPPPPAASASCIQSPAPSTSTSR